MRDRRAKGEKEEEIGEGGTEQSRGREEAAQRGVKK